MARHGEVTFENTLGLRDSHLRTIVWGGAALLLLLPLAAMQFTDEMAWNGTDFLVFGAMLALAGGALKLGARLSRSLVYRLGYGLAVASGFILVLANLAVGLIGSEDNPFNLIYFGVLVLAVLGALIVRGHPAGMARTMFAAALVPVSVSLIALALLVGGAPEMTAGSLAKIVLVNGFFFTLFAGSAVLFWAAARSKRQAEAGKVD